MNKYICPCCGMDVTDVVNARADELQKFYYAKMVAAGSGIGGKISGPKNILKLLANYTPEKRRAAALKAWETKRKKAAENAEN